MKKRKIFVIALTAAVLLALSLYSGLTSNRAQEKTSRTFIKDGDEILTPSQWIDKSLHEIYKIKPGMKRADLKTLFTPDGGLSSRTQNRYLYREAPVKIEVEFEPAGDVRRDKDGRLSGEESDEDVIKKVSKPYLEWPAND